MKQAARILILSLAFAGSTSAIAGPHDDFFQSYDVQREDIVLSKSPPQVYTSNDLDADVRRWTEDGYIMVGASSWQGGIEDAKKTGKFAKKIKASVALVKVRFIETVSGGTQFMMMPVIGGYGGMIGSARPVSFDRYEQTTCFFAKLKPEKIGIGVRYQPITQSQAKTIGSAKGIAVTLVVRGSPAFDAGIIAGDLIQTVAGQDYSTRDRMDRVKADYAGQTVPVEIIRDGQPQTLQITMPTAVAAQRK